MPSEINSSVSDSSPNKILRSGRGYTLSLSSCFCLSLKEMHRVFITFSMKTTDVKSRKGSMEEKPAHQESWELSPRADSVNMCFMVGESGRKF